MEEGGGVVAKRYDQHEGSSCSGHPWSRRHGSSRPTWGSGKRLAWHVTIWDPDHVESQITRIPSKTSGPQSEIVLEARMNRCYHTVEGCGNSCFA